MQTNSDFCKRREIYLEYVNPLVTGGHHWAHESYLRVRVTRAGSGLGIPRSPDAT